MENSTSLAEGQRIDSSITASVQDNGNANRSARNAMSLATLLQPSAPPPDHGHGRPPTSIAVKSQPHEPVNKKRKRKSSRNLYICKKCACPYDLDKDSQQLCIFHSGYMERDEEGWYVDDYGSRAIEIFRLIIQICSSGHVVKREVMNWDANRDITALTVFRPCVLSKGSTGVDELSRRTLIEQPD